MRQQPLEVSELFCQHIGLYPVADFIQLVEMAFSLSRSRQESELEEFIRRITEFHRHSQRYQYFAETIEELKRETSAHHLNERQKCLQKKATKELDSLPWQVYESAQSLENYRKATFGNVWIRSWLAGYDKTHKSSARSECKSRLGCCAATCGCCHRPREIPAGAGPDEPPGRPFMRLAGKGWLGVYAHCSIDCWCCIRRRGFLVAGESEGKLVKEGSEDY